MKRGVTVVELVVVIAIIAVLAGLAAASLAAARSRAVFGGAAGDIASALRRTRAEAFGRGVDTAFVVDTVGGRYWGITTTSAFTLAGFDPASATAFVSGTLPSGVSFGPTNGYGVPLPAPFAGIPVAAPNYKYCSFCSPAAPVGYGAIRFDPGGPAVFSGGPAAIGQVLTLTSTRDSVTRYFAIGIVRRTGAIATFER